MGLHEDNGKEMETASLGSRVIMDYGIFLLAP